MRAVYVTYVADVDKGQGHVVTRGLLEQSVFCFFLIYASQFVKKEIKEKWRPLTGVICSLLKRGHSLPFQIL